MEGLKEPLYCKDSQCSDDEEQQTNSSCSPKESSIKSSNGSSNLKPLLHQQARDLEGFKTPRWIGYVYQIIQVVMTCFQQILSKVLFQRNPGLTPNHIVFYQAVTSSIIFTLLINKQLPYYLYHSIDKSQTKLVFYRVIQGLLMLACIYTSVKYLPLVYVSLVSNIGPLFIAIFSWLLINKGLNRNETITLVVSFIGVCILVTGNTSQQENNLGNTQTQESLWFPILLLMMIPVLTGTLSMTQRQLRNVSEYTTGTYISYSMLVVFGPLILIQGSQQSFDFTLLDWSLFVILGMMSSWVSICRSKSSQYEEPAKLAVVSYFQPVVQFTMDVVFFNLVFSEQQILGIIIVLVASGTRLFMEVREVMKKNKDSFAIQ